MTLICPAPGCGVHLQASYPPFCDSCWKRLPVWLSNGIRHHAASFIAVRKGFATPEQREAVEAAVGWLEHDAEAQQAHMRRITGERGE